MKLSQAIEEMLVDGHYGKPSGQYMCIVLSDRGDPYAAFVDDIERMVNTINPNGYIGQPLICALHDRGVINMNGMSCQEMQDYTTQFYCWWVFDLKRKGL